MKPDRILFIDTETGGLDPLKNSLLSVAFVVWQEFKIIGTKEIFINDGILNVTSESFEINKIDLKKHKKISFNPQDAIKELDNFLNQHFNKDEKITLGGHNINFDVNFLKHFLVSNSYNFSHRFSHRYVDTSTILYYLYLSGKLKQKAISSQEAFDLFGIQVNKRHSALADAIATTDLFTTLLRIIYKTVKIKQSGEKHSPSLFE